MFFFQMYVLKKHFFLQNAPMSDFHGGPVVIFNKIQTRKESIFAQFLALTFKKIAQSPQNFGMMLNYTGVLY